MKRCRKCKMPLEGPVAKLVKTFAGITADADDPHLCSRCAGKKSATYTCSLCERPVNESNALAHVKAEEYLIGLIKKDHPEWEEKDGSCSKCLDYYRELVKKTKI